MSAWNFADVWEAVALRLPSAPALRYGDQERTWAEFNERANGLAKMLIELGAQRQDRVAQYLYNCPEYLESAFASLKVALVPVNINYRYKDDEVAYLLDNSDAVVVVFHGIFAERIERVRPRVPGVRGWLWVDDGSGPCPSWAIPYEDAATCSNERSEPAWGRSPDDLVFLYTGGTTGMPKCVMWRQDDLFSRVNGGYTLRLPPDEGIQGVHKTLTGPGPVQLPACPLMHGTGIINSFAALSAGGCVVTLTNRSFDPIELLDTIDSARVNILTIVGDAFAKLILGAIDEHPQRWSLETLRAIISAGVMWSAPVKEGLLRHHPTMDLIDVMSSSEALGVAASVSSGATTERTAHFRLGPEVRVIRADGTALEPGSGEPGLLALGGRNPLGYFKDPEKSAATFKEIQGARYSIPGDWAIVDADGTIKLLGRGSVCINTGGEKVFPEEVEEVLKAHPAVSDAVVVGVPDDRFGEAVSAAVELNDHLHAGTDAIPTEARLVSHVKEHLASYKAPKHVRFVASIGRAPNGKIDYRRHREEMISWLDGRGQGSRPIGV